MMIIRLLLIATVLTLSACSESGSDNTEEAPGNDPMFADPGNSEEEPPVEAPPEENSAFDSGSDLARIVMGLQRVLGDTFVGLNQKLASGIPLSAREQECLGSFEPALGQPLLAIRCPDAAYRISNFPIIVATASFMDSESCRSSLSDSTFSSCRLQEVNLSIQTVFEVPPRPDDDDDSFTPQRPVPVAGAAITYDLSGSNTLTLSNDESGLTGVFRCEYDLQSAELSSSSSSNSCTGDANRIADRLEMLAPVL